MTTEVEEQTIRVRIKVPEPHSPEQASFVRSTAKRQINKSGRRWGKTVGAAIKGLEAFLGVCNKCGGEGCLQCDDTGKVPPKRVLYAAPTAEQVGAFWFEVTTALNSAVEGGYLKKDETEKYIEVPGTQTRIKAKTAWNANSLRGDYADLLILDEFQLMNEDTWTEVGRPMLLDNDGTAVFIYTPPSLRSEGISKAKDPRHASKMYKKYKEDESGRWQAFHFTSFDNPTLSQQALKEITEDEEMSVDSYRREIMAEDDEIELSWLVYSKFYEQVCKIPRFPIPANWPVYSGHDFGKANPAALFLAQNPGTGDFFIFREYCPGAGKSTSQHVEKFEEFICLPGEYGKERPETYNVLKRVGGNVTTEDEIRQGYTAHGWPIMAPKITRVNAQIDRVIGLMGLNKVFAFDDLYNLLIQIANCMWKLDEEKRPTNDIANEGKYHLLACLRYIGSEFSPETAGGPGKPKSKHSF
jgi:hypothetical protein